MKIKDIGIMVNCSKDLVDILTALSTPTLALFGIYIAWRQWHTAELKRKQDLYDKRYAVYDKIREFLIEIVRHTEAESPTQKLFLDQFGQGYFLFGKDIKEYLDHLWHQYNQLQWCNTIRLDPSDPEFNSAVIENTKLLDFFHCQLQSELEEKFSKYLKIESKFWENKMVNWRLGLKRTWIVVTVLWIFGMGWYQYGECCKSSQFGGVSVEFFYAAENPITRCEKMFEPVDLLTTPNWAKREYQSKVECITGEEAKHSQYVAVLIQRIATVLLPPFLVLFLFAMIRWIIRGFKEMK